MIHFVFAQRVRPFVGLIGLGEHNGVQITASVSAEDYEWAGRRFESLSAFAPVAQLVERCLAVGKWA